MALPQGQYGIQADTANRPLRWVWPVLALVAIAAAAVWVAYGLTGCRWVPRVRPGGAPVMDAAKPAAESRAAVAASPELQRLIDVAEASARADDLAGARTGLLAVLARTSPGVLRDRVEMRLGEIGMELVGSRRPMPGKADYVIAPGDSVQQIARRFGITSELVIKANVIADPRRIVAGRQLRLLDWPAFRIAVSKRGNSLVLTLNGEFFKRYAVGTGRAGETPAGTFTIQRKVERPSWWLADGTEIPYGVPENILGTRWMSLAATGTTRAVRGYGIHGTWNPVGIGRASSQGCIRMRNADVEELFMLVAEGTPVMITEQ
jgi:lipoprotein-anchoring transpeptidase ErfK/SrfK